MSSLWQVCLECGPNCLCPDPPAPKRPRGRPPKTEADKQRNRVEVTFTDAELAWLDEARDDAARSSVLRRAIGAWPGAPASLAK